MSRFRVELSPRAEVELERITTWWIENRPYKLELFEQEIAQAFAMLAEAPEAGPPCDHLVGPGKRRTLLRRTQYHVYYRIRRPAGVVEILAIWHTARRKPPSV